MDRHLKKLLINLHQICTCFSDECIKIIHFTSRIFSKMSKFGTKQISYLSDRSGTYHCKFFKVSITEHKLSDDDATAELQLQ